MIAGKKKAQVFSGHNRSIPDPQRSLSMEHMTESACLLVKLPTGICMPSGLLKDLFHFRIRRCLVSSGCRIRPQISRIKVCAALPPPVHSIAQNLIGNIFFGQMACLHRPKGLKRPWHASCQYGHGG